MGQARIFSESEIKFITGNHKVIPVKTMADKLSVGATALKGYMKRNQLSAISRAAARKYVGFIALNKTSFTDDEALFIKDNYLTIPVKTLSKLLGRVGETSLKRFLRMNNLIIPKEIIEQRKADSRIQPGHIPANKGLKQIDYMSAEQIEKTKATRFQKEGQPGNTLYDGAITTRHDHPARGKGRALRYLRLSKGKWIELYRHNWEQIYGPVPKGMCLWCIDGNLFNEDTSNFELITRKENRYRNSASTNLPDKYVANTLARSDSELKKEMLKHPDLIELKRNQLILNRQIKQNGN